MRAVWAMGEEATAAGVPLDRLDAGSGWDGYHLYEYGLEHRIRSRTPKGGPWWVYFYAPATDSAYVVAGKTTSRLPRHQEATLFLLVAAGADEPLSPQSHGRTVASSPRVQGDPDAPGSRWAGDGAIRLEALTLVAERYPSDRYGARR